MRQLLTQAGCDKATLRECGVVAFGSKQQRNAEAKKFRASLQFKRMVKDRRKVKRKAQVARLKELAVQLGRTPTMTEFIASYGYTKNSVAALSGCWATYRKGKMTAYDERTKRLYRAAGMTPWRPGTDPQMVDWKARRREIVAVVKRLGGKPSLSAIGRELSFTTGHHRYAAVLPFRSRQARWWAVASKRLYRARGLDGSPPRP